MYVPVTGSNNATGAGVGSPRTGGVQLVIAWLAPIHETYKNFINSRIHKVLP